MDFDKIKNAVNSIEMSETMKNRVIKNSSFIEKDKSGQSKFVGWRWVSIACVFGIFLSVIIGSAFFNNGDFKVPFSITAYALSDEGNQLSTKLSTEKATLELSTEDRIDGGLVSVSGDGANLIFTDVMLKITGEKIDFITYELNKGKFIEDVALTDKERRDDKWLLQEKIFIIHGNPVSGIYNGVKEIGKTYTVKYNEQSEYKYTLAIPHAGNDIIEDNIEVKVMVTYIDGKTEEQNINVTQESNMMSLMLN